MLKSVSLMLLLVVTVSALPAMATPITLFNPDFDQVTVFAENDGSAHSAALNGSIYEVTWQDQDFGWYSTAVFQVVNPDATQYAGEATMGRTVGQYVGTHQYNDWPAVYQDVANTTYVAGNTYTFSLDVGYGYGYAGGAAAGVGVGADLYLMDGQGNILGEQYVVSATEGSFARFSVSYTATAADAGEQVRVGFAATQDPYYSRYIDFDNAALDVVAVPEPATMSLLALGGLAALIRRRK